ncbi:RelA/SpoT domain-containing protein [Hymenobacter cavernae]|uniref:RelA/SpoT domain-containing protein n=1 Tax=Hymenobacter cavernae TaxID=2044852 RepID=A0ABQ1UX42_9BACT|nr:RelA/SpoT domain-containing protein [Hymenobacter cavernae]GGF27379.1 hypothetical protein GCM10011383_43810 [Hymenobacter cavernae]
MTTLLQEEDFDGSIFLRKCGVTAQRLEAVNILEGDLEAIVDNFKARQAQFQRTAQSVSDTLLQDAGVHSVRYRVKDPYSLAKKIVRKKELNQERIITLDNYDEEITDLSGVRALHLFKNDWIHIHEFITRNWDLKETPVVYYRKGDSDELLQIYREQACELKEHPYGYRSAHYLVKTSLTKKQAYVEIQVRTIFEEGWSEVDHKIRYPEFSNDPLLTNLLMLLNRSAGAADEMSGFVQDLKRYIENNQREKAEQMRQLQAALNKLQIPETAKHKIEDIAKSLQVFSLQTLPHLPLGHLASLEKSFAGFNPHDLFAPGFIAAMENIPRPTEEIVNLIKQIPSSALMALSSGELKAPVKKVRKPKPSAKK